MKLNFFISFFLFTLFFGFFSTKTVLADNLTLSGTVEDSLGHAVSGATVSVNDTNADSTTTDSSGNYSLSVPTGTYNVQVTPLSGSGFTATQAVNQSINANTILNFVLVPTGIVSLTGHVLDGEGQPLINQTVSIAPSGTSNYISSTTDGTGKYSFQVAPGSYLMRVSGTNPLSANAPPSKVVPFVNTVNC